MNLLKHTTAFKMEQFMRSLEAEINRVLAEKHELEAEATASMTEIANLRAENERLRALLDRIAEELSQAGVDDCESGVKWINERAAENYLREYRHTKAAIGTVIDLARAALKENS